MIRISSALADARLQSVVGFLGTGAEAARVLVYDGARPALAGTPLGELLAAIPLMEPIGTVADGALTLTPTGEALIVHTGQATWARVVNGNGRLAWDCDVSDLNGSGELRLPSTTLYAGGFTRIVSGVLG